MIKLLIGAAIRRSALGENGAHRLKEPNVVPDCKRFIAGHGERERLRQLGDGLQESRLPVFEREDVLTRTNPAVPVAER